MGGPFDDPFFDSVFDDMNAPMIQKDVTLKSDDQEIEVRPLPAAGRPDGFHRSGRRFQDRRLGHSRQLENRRTPANHAPA